MKKDVLIIEDEENIAKAEGLILGNHFNIHYAADGDTGLEKIKQLKPHLVVLDLMLPNRGGYDICYHVRQDETLKNTKILMVTAKNQQIDEEKGVLVGADEYLTKPFEPSNLLRLAHKLTKED